MPRITIDATEATSFEPVPNGTYDVKVSQIKDVKTSAKGTPYFSVGFEITDGDYAGRWVWSNYMLAGKGTGITLDFLNKALGEEFSSEDGSFDFDDEDLLGSELQIVTELETYEGEERANVKRILAK